MVGHNKVCTTRGMKERRIRLSANTAIQFYDVQDRLGYDRATMAIDWLMKEAKVAIDALNVNHQDRQQEYRVPPTTSIFNPSETFHQTPYDQNQQKCPQDTNLFSASKIPLDFTLKPSYKREEEPLQPSFSCQTAHISKHGFVNDNGLLEFCFQQELQEDENLVVVPGNYLPSNASVLHYHD